MSLFSLLLRLLLCVTLVANGIGFAQASSRMEIAHAAHMETRAAATAAMGTCHSNAGAVVAKGVQMPHAAMGHGPAADSDPTDARDCCDGSGCQCACPQQASAATAAALAPDIMPALGSLHDRATSQHTPPRLPHVIRPPIG